MALVLELELELKLEVRRWVLSSIAWILALLAMEQFEHHDRLPSFSCVPFSLTLMLDETRLKSKKVNDDKSSLDVDEVATF